MTERVLEGRVALVTGGGRGIGRRIALALAERGASVSLAGRTREPLEEVAAAAREAYDVAAAVVVADVTDPLAVESLVARTVSDLGGLQVLVNNAGIVAQGSFLDVSQEEFDTVLATNLGATALCCRAAGRHLVAQGAGKVINIASIFGERAIAGAASYCASKAAVINLTRALALEWARYDVQVNAIVPGYIATDMNAAIRGDATLHNAVVSDIPAGRFGHVEEVAALAAYLAGPDSDFVTGAALTVDGGQLARA